MAAGTIRRTRTTSNERSSSAHLPGYPFAFSKDTSFIFGDLFLSYCTKFHILAHSVVGPILFAIDEKLIVTYELFRRIYNIYSPFHRSLFG